jgi:hypothetical protein
MVDQDQVGAGRLAARLEFVGLAGTDEELRVRPLDAGGQGSDDGRAGRPRELGEFAQCAGVVRACPLRLQQQRTFTLA